MVTIFAVPKAFRGHFAIIQENAIASWTKLQPEPEIILFGDEFGIAEIAKKYNLRCIKEIKKNQKGTPILSDIFKKAAKFAKNPILAYVNADIILFNNFLESTNQVKLKSFLISGQRFDLSIKNLINFKNNWEKELLGKVQKYGRLHQVGGLDYFIFPKSIRFNMPPFAIGRTVWDNWLIYKAKLLKIPVIDATRAITIIHQNHNYSHGGGSKEIFHGQEHKENLMLASEKRRPFNLLNSDFILTKNGLSRPDFSTFRLWRRFQVFPVINPTFGFWAWPLANSIEFFIKVHHTLENVLKNK